MALFCHHCGTIQPVRQLDHYARLGVERRVDVDIDHLERQFAVLSRTLEPGRFLLRGVGERGHASGQMEALTEAYETLRDPLRRCRYWLSLHEKRREVRMDSPSVVVELRQELDGAAEAFECDRVAQRAGYALEQGIMGLMQALRGQNWQQASVTLVELDGLESLLGDIRIRRTSLTPTPTGEEKKGLV